eukprot:scaffold75270_cov62-Attheya_sp.AAC.1
MDASAVVLHLLIECDVLLQKPDGSWDLSLTYNERLVYVFGDLISAVEQVSVNDVPKEGNNDGSEFASFVPSNMENNDDGTDTRTIMIDRTKVQKCAIKKKSLKNIRIVGVESLEKKNIVKVGKKEAKWHHHDAIVSMREMYGHIQDNVETS